MKYSFFLYILLFFTLPFNVLATNHAITLQDSIPTTTTQDTTKTATPSIEDAKALFNEAQAQKDQSQYGLSIKKLNETITTAREADDYYTLIDAYNLFTSIYCELDKFETARQYAKNANTLLADFEYNFGKIQYEILQGFILLKEGKYDDALANIEEAKVYNIPTDKYLENTILLYEAEAYVGKKQHQKAGSIYERLLAEKDTLPRKDVRVKMLVNLSKIDLKDNNLYLAEENANKARVLAKNHKFYKELIEAYKVLSSVSEKRELYWRAHLNLKEAEKLRDSFFNPLSIVQHETAAIINESALKDDLIRDQSEQIELQQKRADTGKLITVLMSAFLIIISLLTISLYRNNQIKLKTNDLLLRKNLELQLAKEEAEKAMATKAQFLSTVSHELRTPLYAVTGLTHLLLEENPTETQKEHLKSLKFSGDYLLEFINDILQINKIEANKISIQKDKFSIEELFSEVASTLHQTAKLKDNKILIDIDKSVPNFVVGDPLKLSQILINLVGNALKFTQGGTVTIAARIVEKTELSSLIRFEVIDTGIGIPKEMQENIFESFDQGSVQINRKYGGTGLGLTIVKSLLSLFDSDIKVDSEVGKGSNFYFSLRLKNIASTDEVVPTTINDVAQEELNGLHLLLVEDNKINQVITKKMLEKRGMTCDLAENGYQAIDKAKANEYSAILMDIHMPGISGVEATKEIRKFNTSIPIIALTAISIDDSTENFYTAGCTDVVTKPFKPEVFYQKIAENIFNN